MTAEQLVSRFRQFLLWLTIAMCIGIVVELLLIEHYKEVLQWVPLVACGLVALSAASVLIRPNRATINLLRIIMVLTALAGLVGTYVHLTGNLEFAQEINAAKASAAPALTALTGANPALAPGALGVTALVALAATYYHPAMTREVVRGAVRETAREPR